MAVSLINVNEIAVTEIAANSIDFGNVIPPTDDAPATQALLFSISNQSASGPNTTYRLTQMLSGTSAYVIGGWFKLNTTIGTARTLVHSWVNGSLTTFSMCMDTDGSVDFRAADDANELNAAGTQFVATTGTQVIFPDTWVLIQGRVTATTIQIYVDGVATGAAVTTKNNYISAARPLFIGGSGGVINSTTTAAWSGWMRDVHVITDLDASDIPSHTITNGAPADLSTSLSNSGDLKQWFRMGPLDSNDDVLLIDSGPNGEPGTRSGTPPVPVDDTGAADLFGV